MRSKKVWKSVFLSVVILASVPLLLLLLSSLAPEPPADDMKLAREALSQAASANASTYSKKQYDEAMALYDSAMSVWSKQNNRFILFRNYDDVARLAELSEKKADEAFKRSTANTFSLKTKLSIKIDTLNKVADKINRIFRSYPLSPGFWDRVSKGNMLLKEAEIAFGKEEYFRSNIKIADAEYLLVSSYENATENLIKYFESYSTWQKWIDKTIRESRQNHNYAIIIDKFARKCMVYLDGSLKHEYNIELGKNWVGHKKIDGDNATPEGIYRISKKLGPNRTKYHKALLIDYPNAADREEFKKGLANGELPYTAKLGGLIEIHGSGGRGIDWTEGCVALSNKDMDAVYRIAYVGTHVTIVGSLIDIQQILK